MCGKVYEFRIAMKWREKKNCFPKSVKMPKVSNITNIPKIFFIVRMIIAAMVSNIN